MSELDPDLLSELIENERVRGEVPGVAVCVVVGSEVVLSRGFGSQDLSGAAPVAADTLFPIASSSKAFTASVLGTLVDEQRLGWDDPVLDYLPEFGMRDASVSAQITVRDLLSHRTGLPRHDLVWYGQPGADRAGLVASLRHLEASRPLRAAYQYNNLMYATAGHLAEQQLGCTWEEAVISRLLRPLLMSRTLPSTSGHEAELSPGHARRADGILHIPLSPSRLIGPAGSIASSVEDLSRWLSLNLGTLSDGAPVLSPATLAELHRPTMLMPPAPVSWPEQVQLGYGLGWMVDAHRGRRVVHHGGNLDGYSSMVSFMPEEQVGVAVLTNLGLTPIRDIIPRLVYDLVLGQHDTADWSGRFHDFYAAVIQGAQEAARHRGAARSGGAPARPLADYCGTFTHPAYGTISVSISEADPDGSDGLALTVRLRELELPATHLKHDAFSLRFEEMDSAFPCSFGSDFDGEVDSISVLLEPEVAAIRFERDPEPIDQDLLDRLPGTYRLASLDVVLTVSDGTLLMQIGEQAPVELRGHRADQLRVVGSANTQVEVVRDGAGAPVELVIWPSGRFTRVP